MNKYLKLMRIDNYLKNIIVLLPLLFSGRLFEDGKFAYALLAMLMFCLISSAVYVMNDLADAKTDRINPAKCHRPIASGAIPVRNAFILLAILVIVPLTVSLLVFKPLSAACIGVYFVINIFYSLGLKNVMVVDVALIVSGFVIRVFYGTIVTDIDISPWFYVLIASIEAMST